MKHESQHWKFLLIENIHGALFSYKQTYDEKNKSNYYGHISEKSETSSRRSQVGPLEVLQRKGIVVPGDESSVHATAPEDLPVGQDMEVEVSDVEDPDPGSV